ncbi:SGNH/GDSL hydrolase family protein [Hymenobacter sp. BT664]|uniref:SGNH/GDSL hydrolase family protein n=1 Tax=Hymenobacter montanus TaxID=2771359 RepID=A0A927B9R6_9BACT|nr:SGNH/GDSL hydrolase family protein [Hymenobacter montanus]MBD2766486.1 SGNH/GDSL hydrolase family protein [Hymenobacter montanus]
MDLIKVLVGSTLYVLTWVVLRKYRQQFNLINQLIQENPQTTFVCISPFPAVASTHNLLRRLGGLILKHRFDATPNLRWVDSHDILRRDYAFLPDGIHLNKEGHKALADDLYAVCRPTQSLIPG